MKTNLSFLVLVICTFLFSNCEKEESQNNPNSSIYVAEVNTPIYGKITATWCGPCGQWGWTLNDTIMSSIKNRAITMGLYASKTSNFANATVVQWYTDFGGQSFPNFTFNGINKTSFATSGGIYTSITLANIITSVDSFIALPVQMSAGGNLSWNGQKLTVKSSVKSFKDQSGEFYVGAYMIEDKANSIQNGQTGVIEHHHVCRGSMNDSAIYGIKFNGGLKAGEQTDLPEYVYTVPDTWVKENMYVAMVIWKKEGNKYTFVNAAKVK